MKKLFFFDAFYILSFIAVLFVLGFHIGKEKDGYIPIEFTVTIRPEKISGIPDENKTALVDGKYETTVLEFCDEKIVILCKGYYSEAGYMLCGAKYISQNQPIKANQNWGYFDGRIYEISDL